MIKIFVAGILFLGVLTQAKEIELETKTKSKIENIYKELVKTHYPELKVIQPEIYQLNSEFSFMETDMLDFYKSATNRRYVLRVSPKVVDGTLSDKALKAIMAHELQHFSDYLKMNLIQVVHLGIRYNYLKDTDWIARFERSTDHAVVNKGFAEGLIEFRQWLYKRLDAKDIAKKKQIYLSPAEIRLQQSLN